MNVEQEIRPKLTDKNIISNIMKYVKKRKRPYIIAFLTMVVAVGISLSLPLIQGQIAKMLGLELTSFIGVGFFVLLYSVLLISTYAIEYVQTMTLQTTGQGIIYEIREDVFSHLEKYSIAQLTSIPIGKLVTRVTSDVNTLSELFTNILINLIKNGLMIIGVLIVMFAINPTIASYVFAVTPLVFILSVYFRKTSRKVYREVRHNVSNVNAFLSENISGIKITQVFNQEQRKLEEFREKNNDLRRSSIKQVFVFGVFRPAIQTIYLLTTMLVFYIGSRDALNGGKVTYDLLIIFQQLISQLFTPIQELAEEFNLLQSAFASSERIFETLDTKVGIEDEEDAMDLPTMRGEIEFKNVWFSYIEGEWVLRDVSFKIEPGQTVAFVGATGSGKTSILNLIVRNYDIQKGQILIDGIDIKKIKISSLRKHMGQMLQDVFLFSGTIASNIQMRSEEITLDEVKEACHYVNAHHFIEQLPNQYEEIVRERGNNFSSGQRQLLSFARTIVHKPSVMILDEATANIDTETEVLIQDSLEKMMNIGTMIIVAHRLSTIQHANKIIVLSKGVILEEGTHQELLKMKNHYYKLYQLQYLEKKE